MAKELYKIVIYRLEDREHQIVAAEGLTLQNARLVARKLCGEAWQVERRPDLHTCGNLVMAILKAGQF